MGPFMGVLGAVGGGMARITYRWVLLEAWRVG